MLGADKNKVLCEVGPDKPMGRYLRRYWMPIAGVSEFEETPIRPIKLLGENLVVYKDLSGNFGLVDRQCPHRRADLSYGFVEACGIRCNYHGWLFGADGKCLEQPYEDVANAAANFKDKVTIRSYPVEARAGLLWAYMGPLPAPLLPNWEPFTWENGFAQICIAEVPCNWFQCQENSCDPVHFEWMHLNWSIRLKEAEGGKPYSPRHLKVDFDEFEHGFLYRRLKEDMTDDNEQWTIGRVALWPNGFFLGDHFEWRVPIDDETTLNIAWMWQRVPVESEPYRQARIPAWRSDVKDPATGRWVTSHVMNQDFVAWAGQGTLADRSQEHLGSSDKGIVMMRRRYFSELEAMERGDELKGMIRDPEQNKCVTLPLAGRRLFTNGLTRQQLKDHPIFGRHLKGFPWQHGQPPEVWRAYLDAMGVEP